MWNAGLDKAQAGIKTVGGNINNLIYAGDTTLMAESKERTKVPLDENEREEWKNWLKTQHSEIEDDGIWSHHFMANRQGNNGNSLVQFSHSVVYDSLRPHGLKHTRPPCPSPTPGVYPAHVHWVGDAIQPSHPLSSPSPPTFYLSQH